MIAFRSFDAWVTQQEQALKRDPQEELRDIEIYLTASTALLHARLACLFIFVLLYANLWLVGVRPHAGRHYGVTLAVLLLATLLSQVWSIWYSKYRSRDEA